MTPRRGNARRVQRGRRSRDRSVLDEMIKYEKYDPKVDKAAFDAQAMTVDDAQRARGLGISLYDAAGRPISLASIPLDHTNSYTVFMRKRAKAASDKKEAEKSKAAASGITVCSDALEERLANSMGFTLYDTSGGKYRFTPPRSTIPADPKALALQAESANDAQFAAQSFGISLYDERGKTVRLNMIPEESKVYTLDPGKKYDAKKVVHAKPAREPNPEFQAKKDAQDERLAKEMGFTLVDDPADRRHVISPLKYVPSNKADLVHQAEAANDAQIAWTLGISLYDGEHAATPLDKMSSTERVSYVDGIRDKSLQTLEAYLKDHRIPVDDKMACLLGYVRAAQINTQLNQALTHDVCATALGSIYASSVPRDDREQTYHNGVKMLRDQLKRRTMFENAPMRFLYFRERFEKFAPEVLDHQLANL